MTTATAQQTATATKISAVTKAANEIQQSQSASQQPRKRPVDSQQNPHNSHNSLSDLYVDSLIPAIVTSYTDRRGYGFCTVTSGEHAGENVFFHASCQRCCEFTSDMKLAIGVSPVVKKRCAKNCTNIDNSSKIYIEPALAPGCEILIAEPHRTDDSKSSAETTRWMLASEVVRYEEMLEILPVFEIESEYISSGKCHMQNPRKVIAFLGSALYNHEDDFSVVAYNDGDATELTVREAIDLARVAKEEFERFLSEMA